MSAHESKSLISGRPRVSVIMIFLNTERFITEAVESVFAQTLDDWELLVVDDGSADGSSDIARDYARRHPDRVRYLEHHGHRNRGMSASRNLGLRHARGRFVAFIDSDDVWLPDKLEQQVAILEGQPEVGMLVGATLYWYSWTERPEDIGRDTVVTVGAASNTPLPPPTLLAQLAPLGSGRAPSMSNVMFRREVVDRVGGFEDQFHGLYEDGAFLAKVYLTTAAMFTGQVWDQYRQHASSALAIAWPQHRDAARQGFFEWLEAYLDAAGQRGTPAWGCVERELWACRHPLLSSLTEFFREPGKGGRALCARLLAAALPVTWYLRLKRRLGAASGDPAPLPIRSGVAGWHVFRAQMLLKQGHPEDAVAHYRQALTLEPERADWWVSLAGLLLDVGAAQDALVAVDRALAIRPEAGWYVLRTRILLELGRADDARADFQQAVDIDPGRATQARAELLTGTAHAEAMTRAFERSPGSEPSACGRSLPAHFAAPVSRRVAGAPEARHEGVGHLPGFKDPHFR